MKVFEVIVELIRENVFSPCKFIGKEYGYPGNLIDSIKQQRLLKRVFFYKWCVLSNLLTKDKKVKWVNAASWDLETRRLRAQN